MINQSRSVSLRWFSFLIHGQTDQGLRITGIILRQDFVNATVLDGHILNKGENTVVSFEKENERTRISRMNT